MECLSSSLNHTDSILMSLVAEVLRRASPLLDVDLFFSAIARLNVSACGVSITTGGWHIWSFASGCDSQGTKKQARFHWSILHM